MEESNQIPPRTAAEAPVISSRSHANEVSSFANAPYLWPASMRGQPGAPIRVHLVDSDPVVRRLVSDELTQDSRTAVAGEAASLRDGRRLVRDVAFDVLLVELHLQDGSGLELIGPAKAVHSAAEVMVLSHVDSDDDALLAFESGAAGFLSKNSWFVNYVQSVLQVANGGASMTPSLSRRLLARRHFRVAAGNPSPDLISVRLTDREQEVLRMIVRGLTSIEIAQRLAISYETVKSHTKKIHEKLQVHTRAQAVSCATAWGLL